MAISTFILFALIGGILVPRINCNNGPNVITDVPGLMFELLMEHMSVLEIRLEEHFGKQIETLAESVKKLETLMVQQMKMTMESEMKIKSGIAAIEKQLTSVEKEINDQEKQLQKQTADVVRRMARKMETMDQAVGLHQIVGPHGQLRPVYRERVNIESLGKGWTVFQRKSSAEVNFDRSWEKYRIGFGNVEGDHWLGLETVRDILQAGGRHELLIVLETFSGEIGYAHYDNFSVGPESDNYRLTSLGKYSGTVGDSLRYHENSAFSTSDRDNDSVNRSNCAAVYHGGWWFHRCMESFLNGRFYGESVNKLDGMVWKEFNDFETLRKTTMMIRPYSADTDTSES
ncbi:microfibril-associated glycoprotein 4-like [Anopheles ziemanni]|uniref:microfibril-associated glycoprotein 4-like n=1 Tax=Anopheles coustani TaxID=139045 RepID=UPI002659A066|nr:microfibril-associated glycoprotein 4-like [Anopheles coustani]XP_058178692.1 microfibril-associated glycoprotein 4-like [Anopheles ziemanni]